MMPTTDSTSSPLLTVAVPTYNRARYLAVFLKAIAPQLSVSGAIEVLICDNASEDETRDLVGSYISRGLPIRYIRNNSNLGPDRNILNCYEHALGKYVWICGDDDVVEPFGLDRLMPHLQSEEEYDLLWLRARGFHGEYAGAAPPRIEKLIVCTRAEDFARRVHVFFTFISGIIVNKKRVSKLPHIPFSDLVGTNLVQLGWTYAALDNHRRSLIIQTPLIATLLGNTGGYPIFRVFGVNLKAITDERISAVRVRSAIYRGTLQGFLPVFVLNSRGNSQFKSEDAHAVLRSQFGGYMHYWIFNFPLAVLPRFLGVIWYWGVRIINRIDRAIGNPLLRVSVF